MITLCVLTLCRTLRKQYVHNEKHTVHYRSKVIWIYFLVSGLANVKPCFDTFQGASKFNVIKK